MEELISKPVPGYEGLYKISINGKVVSQHKRNFNNELKQRIDRAGYFTIRLSKDGETSTQYVHRLLALTFIETIPSKNYVNHINGNKLDNNISNLEWVTHSENMLHAYKMNLCQSHGKRVIDNCSGKVYQSIKEAADENGITYSTCKNYLNGLRKNMTCLEFAA